MSGLSFDQEPADLILDGDKTWEIRGFDTIKREVIAIIPNKTGEIRGEARIIDSFPLTRELSVDNFDKHQYEGDMFAEYDYPHAWVLADVKHYAEDMVYTVQKPQGARLFVTLQGRGIVKLKHVV